MSTYQHPGKLAEKKVTMQNRTEVRVEKTITQSHVVEETKTSGSSIQVNLQTAMSTTDGRSTTPMSATSEQQRQLVKEKTENGDIANRNTEITIPVLKSTNKGSSGSPNVKHVDVAETQGNFSNMVVFVPQTSQSQVLPAEVPTVQRQRPSSARAPLRSGSSQDKNRKTLRGKTLGFPPSKSLKTSLVLPSLPDHEDQITTKAWLRMYSLHSMNLDLHKLLQGPVCEHADDKIVTMYNKKPTKYCYLFPSININGVVNHLRLSISQLQDYERQMELVLRRYLKRLIWLLSGSRYTFGTMVHQNCVILIDTSGSMAPHVEHLKKELVGLIWEQFYSRGASFNLLSFSGHYEMWSNQLECATLENCHSAMDWGLKLKTCGSSKTLDALKAYFNAFANREDPGLQELSDQGLLCCLSIAIWQIAFELRGVDAVYLLTDGKPNTSTPELLKQVSSANKNQIPVNTISFNCKDITANEFLQSLASQTGGRYHKCHTGFNAHDFTNRLSQEGMKNPAFPHLPTFESDDLSRLGQEISLARKYVEQVKKLRELYGQAGRDLSTSVDGPRSQRPSFADSKKSSSKSHTPRTQYYNFFKDTYWVPGVWRKFWKYPPPKHVIAGMIEPLLPEKEEQITSEKWLTTYRLSIYKMHLLEMVAGEDPNSKFSDIYARFRVGGEKKYLRLLPQELIYYEILIEKCYKRYIKRLHWLLTSSRLVFGTVIHRNTVIVVDTSGSMKPSMEIMQKALVSLIWEQIYSQDSMFTLVDFSGHSVFWKVGLQPATKENCEAAVKWVAGLKAESGTNTLEAIQKSLQVPGIDSIYLLSDGAPQQTPAEILQHVETQYKNCTPINTISFNCTVDDANKFLEDLSTQTGGRYHRYLSNSKAIQVAPVLQTKELEESDMRLLAEFEGDDLRNLVSEITIARKYLLQVRQYRALSKKKEVERPLDWTRSSVWPRTKVHKFFVQRPVSRYNFITRPKSSME